MSDRVRRFQELEKAISQMDSGVLQVQIYKGMPVKIRLVSQEIVLGGESVLNLEEVDAFSTRKWWTKTP